MIKQLWANQDPAECIQSLFTHANSFFALQIKQHSLHIFITEACHKHLGCVYLLNSLNQGISSLFLLIQSYSTTFQLKSDVTWVANAGQYCFVVTGWGIGRQHLLVSNSRRAIYLSIKQFNTKECWKKSVRALCNSCNVGYNRPIQLTQCWRIYEIIHFWTVVVDESEEWSSQ